ncbi:arylsulfatase B-like [Neodiprion lecontei]|uniref:Arylsulfatase B-like n=1 Tax=Neodiprion lecontei TaxID=441921 RepID=A0A6J0BGY2_NEOLC|nr:arylsulfatase B-like [Neodiprion lecontei]XP_046600112.1 arylsulfatase B-like [Neodiprion lecontei]XP_046600113.1 arylsulfatase B-like [Neodiprion lecontei]XP_046600114.1 arylsulfatase B-like [Neodiprion lecontei]
MDAVWLRLATLLAVLLHIAGSPSGMPYSSTREQRSKPMEGSKKPHIVVILADDLGWNDVSFHGSNQIPTPNIDALAYNGVILNSHYVPALCTPSRSALMTGKYPIHLGMQHSVILEPEPRGLPLKEKLLPEYLRDAGYKTHAIGKWHLGYHRVAYTPTYRGFDSHFGYWNGLQDYYSHEVAATFDSYRGFDMRRNMTVARDTAGKYSTDLFTEEAVRLIETHNPDDPMFMYLSHLAPHTGNQDNPFQAPDEEVAKFTHIVDPERRIYAAMVSKLDQSVGEVVAALRRREMLENSIILFMSDNGAPTYGIHSNRGSNYPMRGIKDSPWEGGVRGVAAIWSPLIDATNRVSNQLMYMTDWLPTLYAAAGLDVAALGNIDGVNMWPALRSNKPSPRSEVVVNIDDVANYAAIRMGDFKYIIGATSSGLEWYGESGKPEIDAISETLANYDPDLVMKSRSGVALTGVITARQVEEVKKMRENHMEGAQMTVTILTALKIHSLRSEAVLNCNVKEENKIACNPLESPCLFNIKEDPCEMVNLAKTRPLILATLEEALMRHRVTVIPASNVDSDPKADPKNWQGIWVNWNEPIPMKFSSTDSEEPKRISGPAIALIAVLLGLTTVGVIVLFTVKFKKNSCTESHPEHGTFQQIPGEGNDNGNNSAVLESTKVLPNPKSIQSFKEFASLKDLARNID